MENPKIVQDLLDKKASENNGIDLDTYASGLLDMHTKIIKLLNRHYDIVHVEDLLS